MPPPRTRFLDFFITVAIFTVTSDIIMTINMTVPLMMYSVVYASMWTWWCIGCSVVVHWIGHSTTTRQRGICWWRIPRTCAGYSCCSMVNYLSQRDLLEFCDLLEWQSVATNTAGYSVVVVVWWTGIYWIFEMQLHFQISCYKFHIFSVFPSKFLRV